MDEKTPSRIGEITEILQSGDKDAIANVILMQVERAVTEKRKLWESRGERPSDVRQTVVLKTLVKDRNWENSDHLIRDISVITKNVLRDLAKHATRGKRDERRTVPLSGEEFKKPSPQTFLDITDLLEALEDEDPIYSEIIRYRVVDGYNLREIAELFGRDIRGDWNRARSILQMKLV